MSEWVLIIGVGALASAASLPAWRAMCRRLGLVDDPGPRKIHSAPIPLAGGAMVLTGVGLALLVALGGKAGLASALAPGHPVMIAVWGALGMFLLGVVDDRWELRPWPKSVSQLVVAGWLALAGPRWAMAGASVGVEVGMTALWIVTVTNAFNFSDNMNGLCAGLALIAAAGVAWLGWHAGRAEVVLMALALAGGLGGFLPFNYPAARVFLGDAGSHFIGCLLAELIVMVAPAPGDAGAVGMVLTATGLVAVPLLDLVWVVVLRTASGKPFYVGDTNHFSHQLVRRGLSPGQAVAVLWLVGGGLLPALWWWRRAAGG